MGDYDVCSALQQGHEIRDRGVGNGPLPGGMAEQLGDLYIQAASDFSNGFDGQGPFSAFHTPNRILGQGKGLTALISEPFLNALV